MKIYAIGGYSEVGKNMTVVELEDDAFIFDCGFYLPPIVELEEKERVYTEKRLRSIGAVPNDEIIDKLGVRNKVRAIIPSHAHLDHVGAIPFLGHRYNAEVIGTPFTIEVLKSLYDDNTIKIKNKLRIVLPNSTCIVKGKKRNYEIDFINITHSTIQSSMIALHTPEGIFLYSNDFKFDDNPILGKKPNYEKLKELGEKGIKALVVDSLYSSDPRKTASEKVARSLLEDVMFSTNNHNSAILITTFSSHIARLKSIVEFGKKMNREIIVMGRSLNKYLYCAKNVKMCPFWNDIKILRYKSQIEKMLKKVEKDRDKYLLITTGHQGEPGSILDRIARGQLHFNFKAQDQVIFSSSTIPTEINIQNREQLEKRLKKRGVRIFDNVHVSGHGGREDIRDLILLTKPEHIIPSHGEPKKTMPVVELAKEIGYNNKKIHLMEDSKNIIL